MDAFAARLRADRNQIGLTVLTMADQTGISFSYITKIETGRAGRGISPAIVTTLAESLQSDVLEYLSLSNVVPSPLDQLIADKRSRVLASLAVSQSKRVGLGPASGSIG